MLTLSQDISTKTNVPSLASYIFCDFVLCWARLIPDSLGFCVKCVCGLPWGIGQCLWVIFIYKAVTELGEKCPFFFISFIVFGHYGRCCRPVVEESVWVWQFVVQMCIFYQFPGVVSCECEERVLWLVWKVEDGYLLIYICVETHRPQYPG